VGWLNDTRLHSACELLDETHLSIARVADIISEISSKQVIICHLEEYKSENVSA